MVYERERGERVADQMRTVQVRSYGEGIEAELCNLFGIVEPFPSHFHDYYTIGLMVGGKRRLTMNGRTTILSAGDIVLINPGDVHACESADGSLLDYRCFNVGVSAMDAILADLGVKSPPTHKLFAEETLCDAGIYSMASSCHAASLNGNQGDAELLFLFMGRLCELCGGFLGASDEPGLDEVGSRAVE